MKCPCSKWRYFNLGVLQGLLSSCLIPIFQNTFLKIYFHFSSFQQWERIFQLGWYNRLLKAFSRLRRYICLQICALVKNLSPMYGQDESTSSKCFFSRGKRNASSRVNESENKLQCPSSFFSYYNGSHPMANEVKILLSLTSYTWLRRFSILTKDTRNQWAPSPAAWPNSKFSQSASKKLLFDGTLLFHF